VAQRLNSPHLTSPTTESPERRSQAAARPEKRARAAAATAPLDRARLHAARTCNNTCRTADPGGVGIGRAALVECFGGIASGGARLLRYLPWAAA
jgi:hypothetical protein